MEMGGRIFTLGPLTVQPARLLSKALASRTKNSFSFILVSIVVMVMMVAVVVATLHFDAYHIDVDRRSDANLGTAHGTGRQ